MVIMAKSPSAVHGELLWSLSTYQPLHLKRVLKNELKHSVLTKFRVLLVNHGAWHSCGCHLKVADQVHPPMAMALPSCSGPHSKTTRPAFTVKTARELPKNVIECSRHRRGPEIPQISIRSSIVQSLIRGGPSVDWTRTCQGMVTGPLRVSRGSSDPLSPFEAPQLTPPSINVSLCSC